MGVAQHPCVPPILTITILMTEAWENVNEVVQLTTLLLRDITYTIDRVKNKHDKQSRKKKRKIRQKRDVKICGFRVCANVVNQRDICAQYAPSVDAT